MTGLPTTTPPSGSGLGRDVFDTDELKELFDGYSAVTGLALRLVHLPTFDIVIGPEGRTPCKECPENRLCESCRELIQTKQPQSDEWTFYEDPSGLTYSVLRIDVSERFRGLLIAGMVKVSKPGETTDTTESLPKVITERELQSALKLLNSIVRIVVEQAAAKDNLSERHQARAVEKTVSESEQWLRTLINAMPDIVCFKDGQGRWLIANQPDLELFELDGVDYQGKTDAELAQYSDFYREAFLTCMDTDEEAWRAGVVSRAEEVIPRPDGTTVIFDIFKVPTFNPDGSRRGLVVVGRDVTERKQAELKRRELEEQFRQSQKMEAVGRLAGGVAHDLNNLLTPVLGYTGLLDEEVSGNSQAAGYVNDIKAAALRARDLVARLLSFSRKRDVNLEVVELNEILKGFHRLLRPAIRENVELCYQLCKEPLSVLADSSLLERVIMNLAVNAQDAMPGGGEAFIATDIVEIGEDGLSGSRMAGKCAVLTVRDTGEGIADEVINKIFEPFFTTKPVAEGTGLGLATVYSIVERLGGVITVSSVVGEGTEFQILLPVSKKEPHGGARDADDLQPYSGNERIAVVEDEPLVRQIVVRSLKRLDYRVMEYSSPMDFLRDVQETGCSADLLVTDVVMPGMDGVELYRLSKQSCPMLKGLFMSGYSEQVFTDEMQAELHAEYLQKPFLPKELARRVRAILDR
jgi:two-component system cell cycle sensor histidine kinase/response regulator CckA